MNNIKEAIKQIMKKSNVSYAEMMTELSVLGRELIEEGTNYMSDVEFQKYKEFEKEGNGDLELALIGASWTRPFAEGFQSVKAMFDDLDFSKPFRVTVDYDPEQPRVVVKKYLTKKDHESCSAARLENLMD